MALRMVKNLGIQAVKATFFTFPAARSRSSAGSRGSQRDLPAPSDGEEDVLLLAPSEDMATIGRWYAMDGWEKDRVGAAVAATESGRPR